MFLFMNAKVLLNPKVTNYCVNDKDICPVVKNPYSCSSEAGERGEGMSTWLGSRDSA